MWPAQVKRGQNRGKKRRSWRQKGEEKLIRKAKA
jgi:hypothetical protein